MSATLDIMTAHKTRRAPFGGGRFWQESKEALQALLDNADANRHLFDQFAEGIARDHGQSVDLVTADFGKVTELAGRMLRLPMGSRVESRRWFTYYDAGYLLLSVWHTWLMALIALFYLQGQDPWAMFRQPAPTASEDDSADRKSFVYKVETLKARLGERERGVSQRGVRVGWPRGPSTGEGGTTGL